MSALDNRSLSPGQKTQTFSDEGAHYTIHEAYVNEGVQFYYLSSTYRVIFFN